MSVEEFVLTAADILLEQVCHFCNSCFYFRSIHRQTHGNRFIGHCCNFRYQIWGDRSFQFPCCATLPKTSKVSVQGYSCFLVCVGSEPILLSLEVWEVSKQWRWQKKTWCEYHAWRSPPPLPESVFARERSTVRLFKTWPMRCQDSRQWTNQRAQPGTGVGFVGFVS